jgi:hypothetical protein
MFSILISLGKAGSEPVTFTLPGPQFRLGE